MHSHCVIHRDLKPENIVLQHVQHKNKVGSAKNL